MLPKIWTEFTRDLTSPEVEEPEHSEIHDPIEEMPKTPTFTEVIAAPTLLAWSSWKNNYISIIELEKKQNYSNFTGVQIHSGWWTHVKEIPNTKLLVSLNHNIRLSANMKIFDLSKKGHEREIYSFEEVHGETGFGDVTYNSRRNILGSISLGGKISYHLYNIEYGGQKSNYCVKLLRKSKWHSEYSNNEKNYNPGLAFDPTGEVAATIDRHGMLLVTDITSDACRLHLKVGSEEPHGRCRWSTNSGESLLFVKSENDKLNILDAEKKVFTLKKPASLSPDYSIIWIDVCQSNGNLLATGGNDIKIKIFDKRRGKTVRTFNEVHSYHINCVRWSPSGDMLTSAASDRTTKLLDFATGKILYTGTDSHGSKFYDNISLL